MELDINNDLFGPLLDLADHFSCTMEVATYLAMMMVGGPKRFFLWYCDASWKVVGGKNIPRAFQASLSQCTDDLELTLLLMRVWFQSGSADQQREKWARLWQVNHEALIYSVEQMRDRMLAERLYNRSDEEYVRPVDLRLMPKVRLLLAHHLVSLERARMRQEGGLAVRGGIYHGSSLRKAVRIHQDSVCHGREVGTFLYFFPDQERRGEEIEAQQVVSIPPAWLNWLEQGERDLYDLAKFIVEQTRYEGNIEVRASWARQRDFLGRDIASLLKPFASLERGSKRRERVKMESYYGPGGICGIDEPPKDDALQGFEEGKVYSGIVTKIVPFPHNYALVELARELRGYLHLSRVWGRCNDIRDEESIRLHKTISVRIVQLDKGRRQALLDERLSELNPLNQLKVGQQVQGTVVSVERKYLLADIHPRVRPVMCRVYSRYVNDMRTLFRVGEEITGSIRAIIPEKQYVEVDINLT